MSNSLRHEANSLFGSVERLDPALDALVDGKARAEEVCTGFIWSEGPVWKNGALFFSDVPANVLYRWNPESAKAEVFLEPSGGILANPEFVEPGSNGLALDLEGRLLLCQSGGRRVVRLEADGHTETVLADRFEGRCFNNPNDLVCHSSGAVYFSDPSYGFKGHEASPLREMPWNGVYRIALEGSVDLLIRDLPFPNGLAFSPDEKTLYIAVSDSKAPRVMAYDVQADGLLGKGRLFFDALPLLKHGHQGTCDGLKVDARGNVFATAPGGIAVLAPDGKLLGTILLGLTSNCAWGDDGSTLYITADDLVCRVKTMTHGTPFRFP
jgi:gluconolactonase